MLGLTGKVPRTPLPFRTSFNLEILANNLELLDQQTSLKSPTTIDGYFASLISFPSFINSASFCFEVGFSVGLGGGGWIPQKTNRFPSSSSNSASIEGVSSDIKKCRSEERRVGRECQIRHLRHSATPQ